MGWSGGTDLARAVIKSVRKHVPDPKVREAIYRPIIEAMENADWDTQDEVHRLDPAFDRALKSP